jgi:hypothetical protein
MAAVLAFVIGAAHFGHRIDGDGSRANTAAG